MRQQLATLGDNCIDVYSGAFEGTAIGGNALNVAVGLQRAGADVLYIGAVGDDAAGRLIQASLGDIGIDTRGVRTEPGSTAVTQLHVTADGERQIVSEDYGVSLTFFPSEQELEALADCALVHACNIDKQSGPAGIGRLIAAMAQRGIPLSYDLALYRDLPRLEGLDIAFISSEAYPGLAPHDVARRIVALGACICVVTCGAAGSIAFDGTHEINVTAVPVQVVDTCGAGDSYIAAFLAAYATGSDLQTCMEAGARAGAETCTFLGAWRGALRDGAMVTQPPDGADGAESEPFLSG